jgi:hypothetical protein
MLSLLLRFTKIYTGAKKTPFIVFNNSTINSPVNSTEHKAHFV